MQIFVNSNYDFVSWRFRAVAFSIVFILIGAALFAMRGVNWGIDFAGGANAVLKFKGPVPMDHLRSELKDASIQQYGKAQENNVLIRMPQQHRESDYAGQVVAKLQRDLNPESASGKLDLNYQGRQLLADLLSTADPDAKGSNPAAKTYYSDLAQRIINRRSELGLFTNMSQVSSVPGVTSNVSRVLNERAYLGEFNLLNQETVGPQVGRELQQKAVLAVIFSTLAMGLYLWLRFDLMFGGAAVVCIVHDVLVALAFLAMINGEFSLNIVAALLLIVGYSINDTVVTYDRVRENRKKMKTRMTFEEQLNLAMNQTLSRTLLTSGTVLLVLVALIAFGGKVIHEFAWILFIGVLAGTYSTVTIVPAVAIAWNKRAGRRMDISGPSSSRNRSESTPREETTPGQRRRKAG